MHFELSPLIVWITLWIVNTYSGFQVNIFSNNRDITNCQCFCTTMTTTPRLKQYLGFSSKNSRAKNSLKYDHEWVLNSLPHGMILDKSNLKTFADAKINVTVKLKCVLKHQPA